MLEDENRQENLETDAQQASFLEGDMPPAQAAAATQGSQEGYNQYYQSPPEQQAAQSEQALMQDGAFQYAPSYAAQTPYAPYAPYNPNGAQQYGNAAPPPQKRKNSRGLKVLCAILAICLCLSMVTVGVVVWQGKQPGAEHEPDPNAPTLQLQDPPEQQEVLPPPSGELLTAEQVAQKVRPSVVGIVVYNGQSNQVAGEGSGIIMGEDKTAKYTYIITCAHVISDRNAKTFVQLEDGTQFQASYIGADKRTDLGVLRIEAKGLPKAEFGKSDALKVGSTVYAVGNPGGVKFFGSFTNGVVSAIGRDVDNESGYTLECIQHNAAISPGNSGGALVNAYGQVVGVNSMKIMANEYEGMGFAVPTSSALGVINELISKGYVPNRPKLGITYTHVNASAQYSMVVQANKLPKDSLIIHDIAPESNLAQTKAQPYDMIIAVNGKNLDTVDILPDLIDGSKVGDTLTLTLCRVSTDYTIEKFDVKVKLIEDTGEKQTQEETTRPGILDPFS